MLKAGNLRMNYIYIQHNLYTTKETIYRRILQGITYTLPCVLPKIKCGKQRDHKNHLFEHFATDTKLLVERILLNREKS